jgi:hypothetical protein
MREKEISTGRARGEIFPMAGANRRRDKLHGEEKIRGKRESGWEEDIFRNENFQ